MIQTSIMGITIMPSPTFHETPFRDSAIILNKAYDRGRCLRDAVQACVMQAAVCVTVRGVRCLAC